MLVDDIENSLFFLLRSVLINGSDPTAEMQKAKLDISNYLEREISLRMAAMTSEAQGDSNIKK